MFGEVGAIHDQDPIRFAERLVHEVLMLCQERIVVPLAFPNELLERPDLPFRMRPHSQQAEGHGFDILAGDIGREQPTQIELCPLALLTAVKQRRKVLVVDYQFFSERSHLFGSQALDGYLPWKRWLISSDIKHESHQVSPPEKNFLSVYPKKVSL